MFVGSYNDTFLIQTQLPLNTPWTFDLKNGVSAQISKRALETFLGVQDSVITISLSNGDSIRISQNYGALEISPFLPILNGPNAIDYPYDRLLSTLNLWGIDGRVGENMPWFEEIFDFSLEDTFIFKWQSDGGNPGFESWRILERFDGPNLDSIHYLMEIQRLDLDQSQTSPRYLPNGSPDTLDRYFLRREWFEKQMTYEIDVEDYEPQVGGGYGSFRLFTGIQFDEDWGSQPTFGFNYHNLYDSTDNAYSNFEYFEHRVYFSGIGNQKRFWGIFPNKFYNEILCKHNGTDTLGSCFDIWNVSTDPILSEGEMLIYPNPARNKLKIELSGLKAGDYILSIMDLQARVFQQQDVQIFSKKELELNLEALAAGFYMVILRARNGQILRQALSIKK